VEHQWTQGWLRQVAMPASRGKIFSAIVLRRPVTFGGQSSLRKGQFRLRWVEIGAEAAR